MPGKQTTESACPRMTGTCRQSVPEQFNLFLPYLADLPLRDQREMMERPFFSLAKTKRGKPIDYTSPDGKLWAHVSANFDYGMTTIWDTDILIFRASCTSSPTTCCAPSVARPQTALTSCFAKRSTGSFRPRSRSRSAPKTAARGPSSASMAESSWSPKRPRTTAA